MSTDSFAEGITVAAAAVTGPLIEPSRLPATGLTAVLPAAIPFIMLAVDIPLKVQPR